MSTATLKTNERQIAREAGLNSTATTIEAVGRHSVRYGLVVVLLWIGAMKFTAYEAEGISGLVSSSPLMAWAYDILSVRQLAVTIGITELLIAGMIATRPPNHDPSIQRRTPMLTHPRR